jgi:hypothetical protein
MIYGGREREEINSPLKFAHRDVQRVKRCNSYEGYERYSALFHTVFHATVENREGEFGNDLA